MRRSFAFYVPLLGLVTVLSACEVSKSSTPTSPNVAGPIAGVEISQPELVLPAESSKISADQQPITFTVNNATSNSQRPVSYLFEVSVDYGFTSKVFSQSGVAQGDGKTSLRLPQNLGADRIYYWRAKAYDGANESDYSAPHNFTVFTPVVIGTPGVSNPLDGSTTTTTKPVLEVLNAPITGPAGDVHYLFELATDPAMANKILTADVPGGAGRTAYGVPNDLQVNTKYYWRAKAFDPTHQGPYTNVFSFVTPANNNGPGTNTPDTPTTSANDQIDMRTVTIALGADVRSWAVTSTMTSVTHIGTTLCTNHTKAGKWPAVPFFDSGATVEGNQWFVVNLNGKWVAGANEWLRPGQTCKDVAGNIGADNFGGTALQNWSPRAGEQLGILVSTPARAGQQGTAERSNVVLITW